MALVQSQQITGSGLGNSSRAVVAFTRQSNMLAHSPCRFALFLLLQHFLSYRPRWLLAGSPRGIVGQF
jgi:hypothetical protein